MMIKYVYFFCGACIVLGLVSVSANAATAEVAIHKSTQQQKKSPRRHLSLLPKLCVEQFLGAPPALPLAGANGAGEEARSLTVTAPQRFSYATDWGVQPFVGSTLAATGEAPERNPTPGGATLPGSAPLCQLDAGVSYSLSPGASLNLGYRLPSSTWSSMFGSLSGEFEAPADKKVSVGISVDF